MQMFTLLLVHRNLDRANKLLKFRSREVSRGEAMQKKDVHLKAPLEEEDSSFILSVHLQSVFVLCVN